MSGWQHPSRKGDRPLRSPRFSPPPALPQGGHIRCIAPSGPFDVEGFTLGLARLRERYVVSHRPDITSRTGFLAGDDGRRLAELREALSDPSVHAIVAARGGYGATRLLDDLATEQIAQAGKLLVGFSDITALHARWAQAGLRSIHGPMVATLGRAPEPLLRRWMKAVEGEPMAPLTGLTELAPGNAEGPLLGGNLSVLAALAGTPHAPDLEDAVLFLEDTSEAPYRIDRLLTTLRQAGWLRGIAGVVLGQFTTAGAEPEAGAMEAVLRDRLGRLGVPVVLGAKAGHVEDNLELPLGALVRITADSGAGTVTFLESAVARPGPTAVG